MLAGRSDDVIPPLAVAGSWCPPAAMAESMRAKATSQPCRVISCPSQSMQSIEPNQKHGNHYCMYVCQSMQSIEPCALTVLQINGPNQSISCQAFRHRLWCFSTFRHRNRRDDVSATTRQFATWISHFPPDMMAET
jgi:hypothetical protein